MKLRVWHETSYRYTEPVTLGHNQVRLTPRSFARQECTSSRLSIEPFPAMQRSWQDAFGNDVTYFTFEEPHLELGITMHATVNVLPCEPTSIASSYTWEEVRRMLVENPRDALLDAALFSFPSPFVPLDSPVRAFAAPSFSPGRPLLEVVRDLTRRIHAEFRYDPQATSLQTTLPELLELRRGVCQDFAHLQIACLRAYGLAARYVSGYLMTRPAPGKTKLIGADASHAWVAVYFPDAGWIDFDPTNDTIPSDEHITLAWGRDYSDVSPIKGFFLGGGPSMLQVSVDVSEIEERMEPPRR